MEKVKIIFCGMEILISIWILYRSGRIVLNKGVTDDRSKFINDHLMIMIVAMTAFLTIIWRAAFSSWILFYCSMIYWLAYMLFMIEWTKRERIIYAIVWLIFLTIIPFVYKYV